ncbi:anillin [Microplitis demolitor]|uniref:anillin n=1 Tax=Microplitis demolitor TaxID=69319 RepID=UPI0004CCA02D|nr:anillin [Microplitis demolitor]
MDNNNTFTARMIRRAKNKKIHNNTANDNTNEYVKSKHSIHCPIDDKSGQRETKNNGNCVRGTSTTTTMGSQSNVKTIKTLAEGNNDSTITSLSAKINDLDAQIANLGIQETSPISTQNDHQKIYPTLRDLRPKSMLSDKNVETLIADEEQPGPCVDDNDNVVEHLDKFKTPMKPPRRKPNLESTRKASPRSAPTSQTNSPNIECTVSTILQTESPLSVAPAKDGDKDVNLGSPILPDEVEHFLENALGDELYNSSITYGAVIDNSNVNASDLMSQTPSKSFIRRVKSFFSRRRSTSKSNSQSLISPPKDSKTLNKIDRNFKLYRSLSMRVKRRLRGNVIKEESDNPVAAVPDYLQLPKDSINSQRIEKLLQEVRIQTTILNQASKALEMCQLRKEFNASLEEVESQRLLLLADIRKRLLLQELKDLSGISDDFQQLNKSEDPTVQCGSVSIKDIKLTLRECLYRESEPGEIQEWFVIVIMEGTNVYASSAISCPVETIMMEFPGFGCIMNDLSPNLKILLEVYVLKLTTGINYQHELKYHIGNDEKSSTCPSPSKFLKRVERHPLSPKTRRPVFLSSSFTVCGSVELTLRDLTINSPWPLVGVPRDSILLGTIGLDLTCTLNFSVDHKGFVNYLDEYDGLTYWTRRWCIFQGSYLLFWNYPEDVENKPPVVVIDLHSCASEKINHVTRSMCARPRTLLIETLRQSAADDKASLLIECHSGFTVTKHLLSYETTRELVDVMDKLNYVIGILRKWKITNTIRPPKPSSSPEMVSEL